MDCKYCNDTNHFLLSDEFVKNIGFADKVTREEFDIFMDDYFVSIDRGYLRLCTEDDSCLDHGKKIAIKFCPMCGRDLTENE